MKFFIIIFFTVIIKNTTNSQTTFNSCFDFKEVSFDFNTTVPRIPDANFFLVGENHNFNCNKIMKTAIFKYINTNYDVRNYLYEYPYSFSVLINNFIQSKDKVVLNSKIFNDTLKRDLDELKKYYNAVDSNKKFTFYGIDFEIDWGRFCFYNECLKLFFDNKNLPFEIRENINNTLISNSENASRKLNHFFVSTFDKYDSIYKNVLGDFYFDFKIIINRNNHFNSARDKQLFDNFQELLPLYKMSNNKLPKFFAQFGISHILSNNLKSFRNLVYNKFTHHIFTIGYQYYNYKTNSLGEITQSQNVGVISNEETAMAFKTHIDKRLKSDKPTILEYIKFDSCFSDLKGIDLIYLFLNFN